MTNNNLLSLLYLTLFSLLFACTENKPIIPCLSCGDDGITIVEPGTTVKKVLLEEFTGVRCVNCPKAQAEIANLQSESVYGENLVAVSYHAGFFSDPYPESTVDFTTRTGTEILSFLETPIGYPSGVVNRRQFEGERGLQLIQFATWGGFVAQALEDDPLVALSIENNFNPDSRLLSTTVEITPLATIAEDLNITVLLTENDIESVQLTGDGIVDDYAQKHVFRTMLTGTLGDPISTSLQIGRSNQENFSFTLPEEWVAENCNIVTFVHQTNGGREVLQVEELNITK